MLICNTVIPAFLKSWHACRGGEAGAAGSRAQDTADAAGCEEEVVPGGGGENGQDPVRSWPELIENTGTYCCTGIQFCGLLLFLFSMQIKM